MKKNLLLACLIITFLLSGYSVYSYFNKKEQYSGQTIVPEKRDDIPLYEGLTYKDQEYVIKGNNWFAIYEFYKNELPIKGWKLVNKSASLEANGGFIMDYEKNDHTLHVGGGWNKFENVTSVMFDLRPIIHATTWIEEVPAEICVYADAKAKTCNKISDQTKINQIVEWVNNSAYDKDDAPLQENYGVMDMNGHRIEVHYDPKLPIYTLKSEKGRKQMKPEPLLELLGLTHLK